MHNGPGDDYVKLVGKAGAALVGYCPLSAWPSALSAIKDPHIAEIAARVGRSPAQARAAATSGGGAAHPLTLALHVSGCAPLGGAAGRTRGSPHQVAEGGAPGGGRGDRGARRALPSPAPLLARNYANLMAGLCPFGRGHRAYLGPRVVCCLDDSPAGGEGQGCVPCAGDRGGRRRRHARQPRRALMRSPRARRAAVPSRKQTCHVASAARLVPPSPPCPPATSESHGSAADHVQGDGGVWGE